MSFNFLVACGDTSLLVHTDLAQQESASGARGEDESSEAGMLGEDFGSDINVDDGADLTAVKPYCSNLSFSGVTWNKKLSGYEKRSLAIALSLSGSFEGGSGWKNLTNNFDGMGLSAGLLNQTLGTGSLQPLLANLKQRNPAVYKNFATSRRSSIIAMVEKWEDSKNYAVPAMAKMVVDDEEVTSSRLDMPEDNADLEFSGKLSVQGTAENSSIAWAKANLYQSNGSFKAEWKAELASVMGHPSYVSEQISAAEVLHRRALTYVNRLGMDSLRAYLFMFDICVQNGGLKESEFVELEAAIKKDRLTSETTILKRLLEIRLRRVLAQWRNDVRLRKTAVIDGAGKVHGATRNFTKQYCYSQTDAIIGN